MYIRLEKCCQLAAALTQSVNSYKTSINIPLFVICSVVYHAVRCWAVQAWQTNKRPRQ